MVKTSLKPLALRMNCDFVFINLRTLKKTQKNRQRLFGFYKKLKTQNLEQNNTITHRCWNNELGNLG